MIINLQVSYSDNTTKEITAKAADIVAFEERFDISMANLQNEVRLTHLLFLAWHTEKRSGATKAEFDKWVETVETIEAVDPKK
jgi:hypothetical protein